MMMRNRSKRNEKFAVIFIAWDLLYYQFETEKTSKSIINIFIIFINAQKYDYNSNTWSKIFTVRSLTNIEQNCS